MTDSPKPQSVKCPVCNAGFGRQEHLARHSRIHTRERPFRCSTCGKSFARLDVLNRHSASHEVPASNGAAVSSRACKQCAAGRIRCTREQPCKRCSERNISCVYPLLRKSRVATSSGIEETLHDEADGVPNGAQHSFPPIGHDEEEGPQQSPPFQIGVRDVPMTANDGSAAADVAPPGNSVWLSDFDAIEFDPSPDAMYAMNSQAIGVSGANWISPQNQQFIDWDAQLADFASNKKQSDGLNGAFPFFLDTTTSTEGQVTHVPWDARPATSAAQSQENRDSTGREHEHVEQVSESGAGSGSAASKSTQGRYYVDGTGSRAPFGGRFNSRASLVSLDAMKEGTLGIGYSQSTTASASSMVSAASYDKMLAGIMAESSRRALHADIASFPPRAHIEVFVRHYFDNFHPVLPFLRKSSFHNDVSEEWIILLAVAAVGSRYLVRLQGSQPTETLLDLLRQVLDRFRHDNSAEDVALMVPGERISLPNTSIRVLQANILCVICMLHSGRKSHMEWASQGRYFLVEACHSQGYLCIQPVVPSVPTSSHSEDELMGKWLAREAKVRTGAMIWFLDSMFLYEFDAKALMDLSDVTCVLPCNDEVWESPRSMKRLSKSTQVTLIEALELLYMEKRVPPDLGDFSTGLVINAIYRRTRDIAIREQMHMNSWTPSASIQHRAKHAIADEPWLPNTPTMSKWRNSACDCLDVLHWSANGKAARHSGLEHHNILQLHISRLIILTPTAHIQVFATASSALHRDGGPNEQEYTHARDQVLQWAIRDQCKARLAIIHCGSLFWHVRRYSCDSVMEPYGIYIATLVLWAFCVSQQFAGHVDVDALQTFESPSAAAVGSPDTAAMNNAGVQDGEPSFFHLDRPLDDELVQAFVRRGQHMSGYMMHVGNIRDPGAPMKILQEGARLLDRDTQSTSSGSSGTRPGSEGKQTYTWGIEKAYIESLRLLVRATVGEAL